MDLQTLRERRGGANSIGRRSWARLIAIAALTLCVIPTARAAEWTLRTSQYEHTAWRVKDGIFNAIPTWITQTTDGYIWVGTELGLLRFDGVRFVPWSRLPQRSASITDVDALLATADGSLWISSSDLFLQLKGDKVVYYPVLRGHIVAMVDDGNGGVWLARIQNRDRDAPLCHAYNRQIKCFGKADSVAPDQGGSLFQDASGVLWMGGDGQLVTGRPGAFTTITLPPSRLSGGLTGVTSFENGFGGSILVGMSAAGPNRGLQEIKAGHWTTFKRPGFDGSKVEVTRLLRLDDGSLLIATASDGIFVIRGDQVDHYGSRDGLSGDTVNAIFQDREKNVWVVTSDGIDRFRIPKVLTISRRDGLSSDMASSVLATHDGTVYVGNHDALDQIQNNSVASIRAADGLPRGTVTDLLEDRAGRLWVGGDENLAFRTGKKFTIVLRSDGKPVGQIQDLIEDGNGDLWGIPAPVQRWLIHVHGTQAKEEPITVTGPRIYSVAANPGGGIVVSFGGGRIATYKDGVLETVVPPAELTIFKMSLTADGRVLARSVYSKVVGYLNWKRQSLGMQNGLPCNNVYSYVLTKEGDLWLYASCGLIEIKKPELEEWWKNPAAILKYRLFDSFDGVTAARATFHPSAYEGPDGKLWFVNDRNVQMIDPKTVTQNSVPPPVHIEAAVADRHSYTAQSYLRLPGHVRDLEIDYAALSFVVPEKIQFRYRLDGRDKDWQDPGTRRQAFYTDLPPGHYTFHVIAANNDGVWNTTGDSLTFFIPPSFYQTVWFKIAVTLAAAALLWMLYVLRLRSATAELSARLGERLQERERIARELHDTLLQDFQAVILRFQLVANHLVKGDPHRAEVEEGLAYADKVLAEGREHIRDIRADTKALDGFVESLGLYGQELSLSWPLKFTINATGKPFGLYPRIRDEIYRIGREAIGNAFRHSSGSEVTVEVVYTADAFIMRIRDDGEGIGADVLKEGRPGHWGINNMRERARNIGASLNFSATPGSGTCIELKIAAELANGTRTSWFRLKRPGTGRTRNS